MSRAHREVLDAFFSLAMDKGPHVFEAWKCAECKHEVFAFHRFVEAMNCPECGHRVASKVPIYKFAMEKAADDR